MGMDDTEEPRQKAGFTQEFCQSKLPSNTKFKIPQIQKESVLKFFSSVDINKATGTDMIGPCLLKPAPHL